MTGQEAYDKATKDKATLKRYSAVPGLPDQMEQIALAVLGEVPIPRGSREYMVLRNALELACQVGMAASSSG
jgi:hypothetical protein